MKHCSEDCKSLTNNSKQATNIPAEDFLTHIDNLKKTWNSTFVPRPRFSEFSCGVYSSGHLANCDSAGTGPKDAFFIGRVKCYPIDSAISWLKKQASATGPGRVKR